MKYVIVLNQDVEIDGKQRVKGEVITVDATFDKNLIRRIIKVIDDSNSITNSA
jgi:hypothetical protein